MEGLNKQKHPWVPSEGLLEIEFQRQTLKDIHTQVRAFTQKNDLTYGIVVTKPDTLCIVPAPSDFDRINTFLEENLRTLNEMLAHRHKTYQFVIDYQRGSFVIHAKNNPEKD